MQHLLGELQQMQSLPLDMKIRMTERRIREWYDYWDGQVYISFSGGKDSTVLLDIARRLYPDIPAVYVDTGLEYPEIRQFAMSHENVTLLRPKMRFDEVIRKYGYPVISKEVAECVWEAKKSNGKTYTYKLKKLLGTALDKDGNKSIYNKEKYKPLLEVDFQVSHYCCKVMKKAPMHQYQVKSGRKSITAMMADESRLRQQKWLKQGCNAFEAKNPQSMPMAFWKENDVLEYIDRFHIQICSVYGDVVQDTFSQVNLFGEDSVPIYRTTGCQRTGCVFCGFGCHLEKGESRFQRLKRTHPKQWKYCIEGGAYDEDGLWKPNKDGLGMRHVFETLNSIYGENFIRFE